MSASFSSTTTVLAVILESSSRFCSALLTVDLGRSVLLFTLIGVESVDVPVHRVTSCSQVSVDSAALGGVLFTLVEECPTSIMSNMLLGLESIDIALL